MFKKLLVAVLALTIIIGMFSPALATKDPSAVKRLHDQQLPPGPMKGVINPTDDRPVFGPYTGNAHKVPAALHTTKPAVGPCTDYTYNGASYYRISGGDYGIAVRYTPAGSCTLKTLSFLFDPTGTGTVGITAYVWQDGGGVPGSAVYTLPIAPASIPFNPTYLNIDVSAANLIFGSDYYVGWVMNSSDTLVCNWQGMSDNGSTGTGRSFLKNGIAGSWLTNAAAFGVDINWCVTVNACCGTEAPGDRDCHADIFDNGIYYRWSDRLPKANRFTAANECTLVTASVNISSGGQVGTGGIDIKVYSDAAGLPGTLLATKHLAHAQVTIGGETVVDMTSYNLILFGDYHVAFAITNPTTDDYELRSDDGLAGYGRSSIDTTGLGNWCKNTIAFAPDDPNWMIRDSVCCSTVPPVCQWESYYATPAYYWPLPDAYGDNYFNMRFSNATKCTLKTAKLAFSAAGSIGNPGATVYLWKSAGAGFPNLAQVITSVPIPTVDDWYPSWEVIDLSTLGLPVFAGDYHMGYSTIINNPGDVLSIISDNGSSASGRSSEYYGGVFNSMEDDWGIDVAFLMEVYRCCQPPGYCDVYSNPNDQWPVWGHDFARTSESGIELGDLCGIQNAWTYTVGGGTAAVQFYLQTPLIVGDKVYLFYRAGVACIDLLTGAPIWSSNYSGQVNNIFGDAAIDGDYLYIPSGSTSGILCVDRNTGALVWARGTSLGTPLPGATGGWLQGSPPVIIGNAIYFGDDGGGFYALDKLTGADIYYTVLLAVPGEPAEGYAWMMSSLSSDGTNLFVGTANAAQSPTVGSIYCLTPDVAGFVQNWVYIPPTGIPGGFVSAPTFRCDNLFVHSFMPTTSNYTGWRQNLDPLTGVEKWSSYFLLGSAWSSPPATIGGYSPLVLFASCEIQTGGYNYPNARSVRAVNFSNTTVWNNRGNAGTWDHQVTCHATTTQDPYVFYGTFRFEDYAGKWYVADGNTGEILISYDFSGWVFGTAIAHGSDGNDWIVVCTRYDNLGDPGYTSGKVFAFRDMGPRPRMIVPESFVMFPSTSVGEAAPVQRTDADAILNTGCATLNFTATLESPMAPTAKLHAVSPKGKAFADQFASSLVDYTLDEMANRAASTKDDRFTASWTQSSELANRGGGEWLPSRQQVKPAEANSAKLAPPTFVSWVVPAGGIGTVSPAGSQDFTFQFDRSQMQLLGSNAYYVLIMSDDPDFNVEDHSANPQAYIEYQLPYLYCEKDSGRMYFGDVGGEWWTNYGLLSDAAVTGAFDLGGAAGADPAAMFAGTDFFMTSMNSCAWNPVSGGGNWDPFVDGGFLFPFYVSGTDCGGCNINTILPVEYTTDGGLTYPALHGDICTFAMIDSGQSMGISPYQTGPSMGILVKYREVGAYGPDFGNFKLTVFDVINRNATPITGLYCGSFIDWDVSSADRQYGDADKGIIYQYGASADAFGQIGIPSKGSYWPDGTKTDPMYNGRLIHSADEYWKDSQFVALYRWHNDNPEGSMIQPPIITAGTDKALSVAFAKFDLAGSAQKTYGYAKFGIGGAMTVTDVDNLRGFVNKFAGFGRGDIDNNNVIDLRDLVRLQRFLHSGGPGPVPFKHMGDVNNDGLVNDGDCAYLAAYFFNGGTPPKSAFKF